MFDTISIGSATLDIFMKSGDFHLMQHDDGNEYLSILYGSKINADDFAMQSGGGATNTAVGFARLGLRAAVVAEIGRDLAGQVVTTELYREDVDTSLIVQEKSEHTAISALLISGEGGRSIVTARGASYMLTIEDIPFPKLNANWIHMSSIGDMEVVKAVAQHCKQNHIRFSWNPGGTELKLLQSGDYHLHEIYPTVFFVNDEEAQRIQESGYDLESAGANIVVTQGKEGGRYYAHGQWESFNPVPADVLQVTGAGDAFVAGTVGALLHDRQLSEAVRWGARNSASVIQHMGAKTGLSRHLDDR